MKKIRVALVALLLALSMTLSGCNLVGIDPIAQLQEDRDKLEKEYETVLAEYDGGTVQVSDVLLEFYEEINYYYMYASYGLMDFTEETIEQVKEASIDYALQRVVHIQQAEARGIELTDEEVAELEADAQEYYDSNFEQILTEVDGKTAEIRQAQAEYYLYMQGYDYDNMLEYLKMNKLAEKVQEEVREEVEELTEEALQSAYEEQVEYDQEIYEEDPGSFESAMTGDTIVTWIPEEYRTVKHILIIPDEDLLEAVTDARSVLEAYESALDAVNEELAAALDDDASDDDDEELGDPEELREQIATLEASIAQAEADLEEALAACLASEKDKIDDIESRLEQGEDFETLIDEYGEDPGMQNEPTRTRGYYVSLESTSWDSVFKNAAMLLDEIGDVSEPVIGQSGIHIIRYETDATPGAVPLDDVREEFAEEALETQRDDHYIDSAQQWFDDLNVTYYYDNWDPA